MTGAPPRGLSRTASAANCTDKSVARAMTPTSLARFASLFRLLLDGLPPGWPSPAGGSPSHPLLAPLCRAATRPIVNVAALPLKLTAPGPTRSFHGQGLPPTLLQQWVGRPL